MTESTTDLTTKSDIDTNVNETDPDIFEQIVNSNIILFEPWFMGIIVTVLLVIIIATLLYTMLCRSRKRRNSREAILNMTEEQERAQLKPSCKKPCAIIGLCTFLIIFFVSVNFLVYHLRETGKTFQEFMSETWSIVYSYFKEPWFISILFGILLCIAILVTIHSILKENKMIKKHPTNKSNRRKKKGLFSKPWFVAFLLALVVIVILSLALFRLSCQKPGEELIDTMSRFFIFEPWFFGIVVGVILLTLIIFNIFRILRGASDDYSVNGTEPLNDPENVVESQGFEEYPSKSSVPTTTCPTIIEPTTQLPVKQQTTVTTSQEPQVQNYKPSMVPSSQNIMPQTLSLQLNEGTFFDEKQFHDEDDSMAEYGLGENDQFNDEGSFIGLYNRDRIQNYMAQFNKNNLNN